MMTFDGEYLPSVKAIRRTFTLALTISETLTIQISDLENLGQGQSVQRSQWSHSTAESNLYKSHSPHFYASSTRFEIYKRVDLKHLGQGHAEFVMMPCESKCQRL